jgi:hypothetical protein
MIILDQLLKSIFIDIVTGHDMHIWEIMSIFLSNFIHQSFAVLRELSQIPRIKSNTHSLEAEVF